MEIRLNWLSRRRKSADFPISRLPMESDLPMALAGAVEAA